MTSNQENTRAVEHKSKRLGEFGEDAAAKYLALRDYRIIARNFTAAIGRNRKGVLLKGEIDLIAVYGDTICFVEVKTRTGRELSPESAVNLRKQRQITRSANEYLKYFDLVGFKTRFDVVTVSARGSKAPMVMHLADFWSPEKFKKKKWNRSD